MNYKDRALASLSAAAKKARAEYAKEWRKKNPDKQREINRRYWEKKAEQAAKEPAPAPAGQGA